MITREPPVEVEHGGVVVRCDIGSVHVGHRVLVPTRGRGRGRVGLGRGRGRGKGWGWG